MHGTTGTVRDIPGYLYVVAPDPLSHLGSSAVVESILRGRDYCSYFVFQAIVNVIGMTKMTPPIKDLLPRLTPILKNRLAFCPDKPV